MVSRLLNERQGKQPPCSTEALAFVEETEAPSASPTQTSPENRRLLAVKDQLNFQIPSSNSPCAIQFGLTGCFCGMNSLEVVANALQGFWV